MALTKIDDRGLKTPIDLLDNEKIRFGTGNDLEIYHNGSDNFLDTFWNLTIRKDNGAETLAQFTNNGAVDLYYDNSKKFETTSAGIKVSTDVQIEGGSGDTELILKRTNTAGSNGNGFGTIKFNDENNNIIGRISTIRSTAADDGDITFATRPTGGSVTERVKITTDGHLTIPYDSKKLNLGTGNDLQIFHNGTNSVISETTGHLRLQTHTTGKNIVFEDGTSGEYYAIFNQDGACELYYDNSKKFETTSAGATIDGQVLIGNTSPAEGTNNALEVFQTWGGRIGLARNDTSTAAGNNIGMISFYGNDANGTYQLSATIAATADLDHDTGDKPGRLEFLTTPDGSNTPVERLRIDSIGRHKITKPVIKSQ